MGVAPVVHVQRPDVVATDPGRLPVHDQHLAVVAGELAEPPAARPAQVEGVVPRVHGVGEAVEGLVDDEVREPVPDQIDLDPAGCGLDEGVLELLAELVALPDEGLEVDGGLGGADGGQHVLEQVAAVHEDRGRPLGGGELVGLGAGEVHRPLAALAEPGDDLECGDREHLDGADDGADPLQHRSDLR